MPIKKLNRNGKRCAASSGMLSRLPYCLLEAKNLAEYIDMASNRPIETVIVAASILQDRRWRRRSGCRAHLLARPFKTQMDGESLSYHRGFLQSSLPDKRRKIGKRLKEISEGSCRQESLHDSHSSRVQWTFEKQKQSKYYRRSLTKRRMAAPKNES